MSESYSKKWFAQMVWGCLGLVFAAATPLQAAFISQGDQNPVARLFLPPPLPVQRQQVQSAAFLFSSTLSNTLHLDGWVGAEDDALVIDGELFALNMQYVYRLSPAWTAGVDIPLVRHSPGELDHFLDAYHSALSLPDGRRSSQPQDRLRYVIVRDGERRLDFSDGAWGLGDIGVFVQQSRQLRPDRNLHWRLRLDLPSGSIDHLTGSGSYDISTTWSVEQYLDKKFRISADLGLLWLSSGKLMPELQKDRVGYISAGLSMNISPRIELAAQIDFHSAVFEGNGLESLESAWLLNLGGQYSWLNGYELRINVTEDIQVKASPDVSFGLTVVKNME